MIIRIYMLCQINNSFLNNSKFDWSIFWFSSSFSFSNFSSNSFDKNKFEFCIINDFPMFEYDEKTRDPAYAEALRKERT